jgi:serine/threonine protein kinase
MPGIGGGTRQPQDAGLNQLSLEYSYAELKDATNNFGSSSQIGHGSFGGVFRGIQKDGTEVAIKALDIPEEAGFEEEVRVLSKFRHPNLVILMGFARDSSRRLLVYELLSGGDVYRRLQKCCLENVPFTWNQRVSVAFDACCGLSHLHHASPKVFHRDIKSPNILLDRNGTAKMADFGLACVSRHATHKVKQASGTVGYACPFYVNRGVITEGSEVYSFGIVMLELLTASPPAYATRGSDGSQQYQFLVTHLNNDVRVAMSMCDPKGQWPDQAGTEFTTLAFQATSMTEGNRPGFASIVNALRGMRDLHDPMDGQSMQQTQSLKSAKPGVQVNGPRYHDRGKVFANSPYNGQGAQLVGGNKNTPYVLGQQPQAPLGGGASPKQGRGGDSTPTKKPPKADQEIRIAKDGVACTEKEFLEIYGREEGARKWQSASKAHGGQQRVVLNAKIAMQQVPSWCADQAFRLCGEGEFNGQARLLSRTSFTSVQSAVDHLNAGTIVCPEGFCVVFSTSNSAYFLLYRSELKDAVYAKFKVYEEESSQEGSPCNLQKSPSNLMHKVDPSFQAPLNNRVDSQASPILWTLECTYSEGTSVPSLSKEKRSLVHRQEVGGPILRDMRVGLLFQEEFLCAIVQDEQNRAHLCREHFQIWAEESSAPTSRGSTPPKQKPLLCSFFLTNMSNNGTIVNGKHVKCTNEQVPLHDGDIIALPRVERYLATEKMKLSLTPWLQFRFDLSRSILADHHTSQEALGAASPMTSRKHGQCADSDNTICANGSDGFASPHNDGSTIEPACLGTSFVGVEMTPLFVLEVGGPAVRGGATPELRRIVHGVPVENESENCPPLLLGRAQQSGFWQRVLLDEAYNSLSRQHLQIEVSKETTRSSRTEFCVRNLSELNPIRVCSSRGKVEDGFDAHPALEKGETKPLQHGDAIVVNPSKDHMLWLVFEHLSSSKLEVSSLGVDSKRHSTASVETRTSSAFQVPEMPGQESRVRRPTRPKW